MLSVASTTSVEYANVVQAACVTSVRVVMLPQNMSAMTAGSQKTAIARTDTVPTQPARIASESQTGERSDNCDWSKRVTSVVRAGRGSVRLYIRKSTISAERRIHSPKYIAEAMEVAAILTTSRRRNKHQPAQK